MDPDQPAQPPARAALRAAQGQPYRPGALLQPDTADALRQLAERAARHRVGPSLRGHVPGATGRPQGHA